MSKSWLRLVVLKVENRYHGAQPIRILLSMFPFFLFLARKRGKRSIEKLLPLWNVKLGVLYKNLTVQKLYGNCTNAWLMPLKHSDYSQHSNKMLAKQPYFSFISCQIRGISQILRKTVKSVEWQPNPWLGGQICGTAAKSVTRRQYLWLGGQICSQIYSTVAKYVARQANLRHSRQICGTAAKSDAQQPNLKTKS